MSVRRDCRAASSSAAAGGGGRGKKVVKESKQSKKKKKESKKKAKKSPSAKPRGRPRKDQSKSEKPQKVNLSHPQSLLSMAPDAREPVGDPEQLLEQLKAARESSALTKMEMNLIWRDKKVGQYRMPVGVLE